MKNWKTTSIGILTIIVALSSALLNFLKAGSLPDWATLLASFTAGWGLIHAADSSKGK